jgi:4-oxalocrotonate tautomerase
MPIIHIYLREGRSKETKRELLSEITAAASRTLGNSPESIRVLLQEIPDDHWGVNGKPISERENG